MDYFEYVGRLTEQVSALKADLNLPLTVPRTIDYAEQRCYRELDLLSTVTSDYSGAFVAGDRSFTFPQHFVTCQQINAITDAGSSPLNGTRNPLTPTSKEVLDLLWPSITGSSLPAMFAMITDQTIAVGPWPDDTYTVEVVGTIRPTKLSAANPTSFLTLYLPDLFMAASMAFLAPADQTWEAKYTELFASANVEEQRRRFASNAWGPMSPTPIATPSR